MLLLWISLRREVLGWNFSNYHNTQLVIEAFMEAKRRTGEIPFYFHSDQGSEYDSEDYLCLISSQGINISMSKKSHPWENGYQESFYSTFKLELGDPERFNDLGELIEAVSQTIYYYNHDRIHTKLRTSPVRFRQKHESFTREFLFKKLGT